MPRTDSREHLFVPKTMSEEQLPSTKLVGTHAPRPQPKLGVSGCVAMADAHAPRIRDRMSNSFINGVTPTKISRSPAGHARSFFLKLEQANEACGERIFRTAL
jgi:hypothetical protein